MELKVKTFCFCCSLRFGCLLFGLICSGYCLIMYTDSISTLIRMHQRFSEKSPVLAAIIMIGVLPIVYPYGLGVVFGLYLAYSAMKIKSYYCFSFLIIQGLFLIQYIYMELIADVNRGYYLPVTFIIEDFIFIALILYTMLAVYSYYKSMPKLRYA